MSAAPRFPKEFGYGGLRMTADEYLALGETTERYELIDGVVVMSPSPTPRHQRVAHLIAFQFEQHAQSHHDVHVIPDVDVQLSSARVYRPDVVVYATTQMSVVPERLTTPPSLVVEVLSPGSGAQDYVTKKDDYERFGVGEYWIVDPMTLTARVYRRSGSSFVESQVPSTVLESASISGLSVDLARIRAALGGK